jgi:hypothetical protein
MGLQPTAAPFLFFRFLETPMRFADRHHSHCWLLWYQILVWSLLYEILIFATEERERGGAENPMTSYRTSLAVRAFPRRNSTPAGTPHVWPPQLTTDLHSITACFNPVSTSSR